MSTPLRPRRERTRQRRAGLGPVLGQQRRQQPLLHGRSAEGVLRRPHTICLRERAASRARRGVWLTSFRQTPVSRRYFCPVRERKLSSFQSCFWPWCWGLDVRVPYHSGMTGTVRDITQTRVSHHSEPSVVGRRSYTGFPSTALGRRPSSATSDPPPILGKLAHLRGPHFCHLSKSHLCSTPGWAPSGPSLR